MFWWGGWATAAESVAKCFCDRCSLSWVGKRSLIVTFCRAPSWQMVFLVEYADDFDRKRHAAFILKVHSSVLHCFVESGWHHEHGD